MYRTDLIVLVEWPPLFHKDDKISQRIGSGEEGITQTIAVVWSLKPTIREELLLMSLGEFHLYTEQLFGLLLNLLDFLVTHDLSYEVNFFFTEMKSSWHLLIKILYAGLLLDFPGIDIIQNPVESLALIIGLLLIGFGLLEKYFVVMEKRNYLMNIFLEWIKTSLILYSLVILCGAPIMMYDESRLSIEIKLEPFY